MTKFMAILMISFLFCNVLVAQGDVRRISVTGKSTVTLEAQYSQISIRVIETDKEMAASYKKLNNVLDKLFKDLIISGIAEDDITKSIIDQGTDYQWQNNKRILKGYFSSCVVLFDVNVLEKLPAVYQILANYEQINILGSTYNRRDEFEMRKIEFKKALQAAKEKASYMASLMDCKLGKVREINEASSDNFISQNTYANALRSEQAPNVSFGSVTISATVHVEFYLE